MVATLVSKTFVPTNTGLALTPAAIDGTNGNKFLWSRMTHAIINNTSSANALTATITTPSANEAGLTGSIAISIPLESTGLIPAVSSEYKDAQGYVTITFTGTTPAGTIQIVENTVVS